MRTRTLNVSIIALLFVLGGLIFPSGVKAQEMKKFTWSGYKTSFEIPKDFTVQESTGDKFSAGDDKINLTIYPKKDENLPYAKMKSSLQAWTATNEVTPDGDYELLENLNGYWGVFVDGKTKEGAPVFLGLFVDPNNPNISLYVWVAYTEASIETAKKILLSITPTE